MNIVQQKRWYILGITALLFHTYNLYATTLVYNMKIRRAFNTNAFAPTPTKEVTTALPKTVCLLTGLPVVYVRNRHIVIPELRQNAKEKLLALGAIFNIRAITPKYWWGELTTGLENQTVTSTGTNAFKIGQTAWDDIILSVGKNFFFKDKGQMAAYIIAGFPINYNVSAGEAQTTLVGSKFYGLGGGLEFSHAFVERAHRSFIGILQTRFVQFFDRSWYPIFPQSARIRPGNIADIFIIFQYSENMNTFEVGYNPTIFSNQAGLFQSGIVRAPTTVRNSFYANYMYIFRESFLLKAPGALGLGFNIARSSLFDTKISSGWLNFTILF